jgi:hypothetical protein
MMTAAVEVAAVDNNSDGRQGWWQMTMTVDNDSMQDWVANYNREGQEQVARDGRDSGVAMMAAAGEDGSTRGQQQRWRTTMAKVNNYGGGQQQWWTTMA